MRVLMITPRKLPLEKPTADGNRLLKYAEFFKSYKYKTVFISTNSRLKSSKSSFFQSPNYQLPSINNFYFGWILFSFSLLIRLNKIIKIEKPDLIFVNSTFLSFGFWPRKKGLKIQYVPDEKEIDTFKEQIDKTII